MEGKQESKREKKREKEKGKKEKEKIWGGEGEERKKGNGRWMKEKKREEDASQP